MRMLAVAALGLFALGMLAVAPQSYAATQTTTTAISWGLSLEKTVTTMEVPENNILPWGYVAGSVSNPAENHPVIILLYQDGVPVHVAQVGVDDDGSYEYKFRVRNVVDGQAVNIFEGQYMVKIFKVVENIQGTI